MTAHDGSADRQRGDESLLVRAVLRGTTPPGRAFVPVLVGMALEVAAMSGFGMAGSDQVRGLPGLTAVAIASLVGIVAKPRHAAAVATVACLAYLAFFAQFGRDVSYPVVAVSSVIWILLSWLVARAVHSLRREVLARQQAQLEVEELYRGLEQGLLPRRRTVHPEMQAVTYYQPGEKRLRLGGDFFDLAVLADGSLALVIGDVIGHGPEAAALSAMLRGAWRGSVAAGMPATEVARVLHHIVLEEAKEDSHATAFIAVIAADGARVDAITAGHPAPLLLAGDISPLPVKGGLPLGVGGLSDAWPPSAVDLPTSWRLFFYTDGLVEMRKRRGKPERFDVEGLIVELENLGGGPSTRDDLRELVASMAAQGGEGPPDDVTIVVVSR